MLILGKLSAALAILLYSVSLLFSWEGEPVLVVATLVLFCASVYLSARTSAAAPDWHSPFTVRLQGAGAQGSSERNQWLYVQTQRGRSIRKVVLSILIAAVALFVLNHARGSISCFEISLDGFTIECTPIQECEGLSWKSHADRLRDGLSNPTETGNNLAGIALTHGIAPSLLGAANPAAVFEADAQLTKDLQREAAGTQVTIEAAAQKLGVTQDQVASRYATTPLVEKQALKIPMARPYDPSQWADWLLWALIGMTAYLLIEVARHLRSVANGDGNFLAETSWYWAQLATGPLIAFVILLLFVHINVDLLTGDESALAVNLKKYPSDLLIVPAFLLGFYGRVTREVLDQIMRKVFAGAWRAANGDFEIVIKGQPGDDAVSSMATLETQPPVVVTWSATAGKIDSSGVFTPPAVESPTQVFITAISAGTNRAVTKTLTAVKHKFSIVATGNPRGELFPGKAQVLTVQPLPPQAPETIAWELVPPGVTGFTLNANTGPQVTLQASESVEAGATVTVKATYAELSRTFSLQVLPLPAAT